ncbi:MAG: AsnC family transcriptional regulator [Acidimicrobiales bacterium]
MSDWSFLTNHGKALLCIAHDPEIRLRDISATLGITERSAYGIVDDLTRAGYVVKEKEGRRNRYQIQSHLPIPEVPGRTQAIGEVLDLLTDGKKRRMPGAKPKR